MSEYILGSSNEELQRLGYQHEVWLEHTLALWREAGFGPGQRLLDLGCGPGFATLQLSNLVGKDGRVVAVDSAENYIKYLKAQIAARGHGNVKTSVSDVHRLEIADGAIDGAFARWLLCFVQDPKGVLTEVFRTLRPGGKFVVLDYYNYLAAKIFPERGSFKKLFRVFYDSAEKSGGSFTIGDKLPELLTEVGFEIELLKPHCYTTQPGSRLWHWLELFTGVYLDNLIEQGLLTEGEKEVFERDWQEVSERPDAFFSTPPVLGIVARKAA